MTTKVAHLPGNAGMDLVIKHDSTVVTGRPVAELSISPVVREELIAIAQSQKNYVFLFDRSGSMESTRWPDVVEAIKKIKSTPGTERFKCIFFNTSITEMNMDDIEIRAGKSGSDAVFEKGKEIPATGCTDIVRALMKGLETIIRTPNYHKMNNRVVLFTDGEPEASVSCVPSLTTLLETGKFGDNVEGVIASLIMDINTMNDDEFQLEQLRIFTKLYHALSIPLHVFGVGITENKFKNVLNDCVNNSTGVMRGIAENDDAGLLKLPQADTDFYDNSSYLVTRIVNSQFITIPSVKMVSRFRGLAAIIDTIYEIMGTDVACLINLDVAKRGDDIVLEKEYLNVSMRDLPQPEYRLQFKDIGTAEIKLPFSIDVNGTEFQSTITIDVKDVETYTGKIIQKQRRIMLSSLMKQMKAIIIRMNTFPSGCSTTKDMMDFVSSIKRQLDPVEKTLRPGGGRA